MQLIVSASADQQMHVWDMETAVLVHTGKGCTSGQHALAVLSSHWLDTRAVFACQQDKPIINYYNLQKSACCARWVVPEVLGCIRVSSSGAYLVGGGISGSMYIWELATGHLLRVWDAHYNKVSVLQFSANDSMVLTAGHDSAIHIFKMNEY